MDCGKERSILKTFRLLIGSTYFNSRPRDIHHCFLIVEKKLFFWPNLILGSGFMRQKTCRIAVCTREENEQMSIESIFLVADCSNAIYQHHFDLSLNKLLAKQKESLYASARLENSAS